MRIVVLVKEVPDTYGERTLSLETGLAERTSSNVADEIGERALEVALTYADAHEGTEVHVLTVAPDGATATVRKCLAMGAGAATHVVDDGLVGADLGLTAEVIAAALGKVGYDVVIAGNQSTDGMGGVLPAMLAELLGVPNLTNLADVTLGETEVGGTRVTDDATVRVQADLPAVVSITEALPDARFPNFKGIIAAKKKPLDVLTLADLGIDAEDLSTARSIMLAVEARPPRAAGVTITDDGDAGVRLAAFLAENHLI
ncbi:Electron transfer flavoprotein alpha/beta- subunit [Xylanimonas cellulosilytica DSM 15894]|uniref:Electron transfer flavoprotein alpha/beta-subunit n=1 Tax=Xylanimonas cellulosilytica (strain DSM 15894 / JCM 12276 / CECT 5975 / KCTC 9989 / LMG 20990 / NBRC 107835 / XIL07) TaxID=446471 RepID=D1BYZ7_XYLCX|nr:electron transfer flavoprotein subunit beta/FixA family protein [Xylanimonas cellulosilytica]ACZ30072.1 Electron transfer flavoprotein alpha/beta- subunit [Xylanimonas cellulosilytica DSM 15894]